MAGQQVEPDPHRPGRPRDHASPADRQRAYRLRQHQRDAMVAADLVAESTDAELRRALAALAPGALRLFVTTLTQARRSIS